MLHTLSQIRPNKQIESSLRLIYSAQKKIINMNNSSMSYQFPRSVNYACACRWRGKPLPAWWRGRTSLGCSFHCGLTQKLWRAAAGVHFVQHQDSGLWCPAWQHEREEDQVSRIHDDKMCQAQIGIGIYDIHMYLKTTQRKCWICCILSIVYCDTWYIIVGWNSSHLSPKVR